MSVKQQLVTQQLICPFCRTVVAETPVPFTGDATELEKRTRDHLLARHPIRWRLHRQFRRAMRVSLQGRPVIPPDELARRQVERLLAERRSSVS